MRISDWSSDVCSSDLGQRLRPGDRQPDQPPAQEDRAGPQEPDADQDGLGRRLHPVGGRAQAVRRLRLWPQGVVGQIIILVALALFVAQAINFALLLRERQRIELTAQTAPGVYRIVDALDNRPDRRGGDEADRRGRVRFLDAAPPLPGQVGRAEEHTSELQSLMRSSYTVF